MILLLLMINYCLFEKLPDSLIGLDSLKWLDISNSNVKHIPEKIFELELEVVGLHGTNLEFIPKSILKNKTIKYFSCELNLITSEITNWIGKQELAPFGSKAFRKRRFYNSPLAFWH